MRRIVLAIAVLLLPGCGGDATVSDADMLRGQVTLAPFKSELTTALTTAFARSPVEAISVCKIEAPRIAAAVSVGNDVRVGRTSHRLRNPQNSPEGWTHRWLRYYLDNPDDQDPHAEYLDKTTIGYVEPIYVKPMCLTCHGESITPEIDEKLTAMYPDDNARDFAVGDFRGLFWLKMPAQADGAN